MEVNDALQLQRGMSLEAIKKEIFTQYDYQIFSTNEMGKLIPYQGQKFENNIFVPAEKIALL